MGVNASSSLLGGVVCPWLVDPFVLRAYRQGPQQKQGQKESRKKRCVVYSTGFPASASALMMPHA